MRQCLLIFLVLCGQNAWTQNLNYVHYVVDSLCSERMAGRGYVDSGLIHASEFVARQFDSLDVQTLKGERFQEFEQTVNTFADSQELSVNGRQLVSGRDFLVNAYSPSFSGNMPVQLIDSALIEHPERLTLLPDVAYLVQPVDPDNRDLLSKRAGLIREVAQVGPVINPVSKLTWSVGNEQYAYPVLEVTDTIVDWNSIDSVRINVKSELKSEFAARNIIGVVPAKKRSKKYVVFTAHYDHLGRMGEALFPGANDNASGVAALLDLARHYAENPIGINVLFIAFAGEEAGLVGSRYFVDNPLIDLKKIEFLINLDLIGNGEDGITVVNGKLFENDFKRLAAINSENNYLEKVRIRGAAANSDHYWFTKKGVPSFFIYTLGERNAYHDIYDVPETLEFKGYEGVFRLVTDFVESR